MNLQQFEFENMMINKELCEASFDTIDIHVSKHSFQLGGTQDNQCILFFELQISFFVIRFNLEIVDMTSHNVFLNTWNIFYPEAITFAVVLRLHWR